MPHTSYITFQAKNNYALGLQLGERFGEQVRNSLQKVASEPGWIQKVERSKEYLDITQKYFPHYIEELKGYATSAHVDFLEFWARSLEDELDQEKCTTIITNNGLLTSHNEDWTTDAQDLLYLVKKTIGELTIFEFLYYATLGGNSISINSHGIIQTINSLVHSDHQIGVPRNVTCRFLSESSDIPKDIAYFATLPRSSGYNHNFTDGNGKIFNLESSAAHHTFQEVHAPYVHTNHYLGDLQQYENSHGASATKQRYAFACQHVQPHMSVDNMKMLDSDISQGRDASLMNERTIGKMIVDMQEKNAYVWMLRENEKGWVEYSVDFIK